MWSLGLTLAPVNHKDVISSIRDRIRNYMFRSDDYLDTILPIFNAVKTTRPNRRIQYKEE